MGGVRRSGSLFGAAQSFDIVNKQINLLQRDFERGVVGIGFGPAGIPRNANEDRVRPARIKRREALAPVCAFDHPGKRRRVAYPAHTIVVPDHMASGTQFAGQFEPLLSAFGSLCANRDRHGKQNDCK